MLVTNVTVLDAVVLLEKEDTITPAVCHKILDISVPSVVPSWPQQLPPR